MTAHLYSGVPVVGGTADWAARFTTWVLDPVRDGLQWLPWWIVLLLVAVLAQLIGTWRTALTAVLAMAAIGVLGKWDPALDTLSQVLAAVAVTLLAGVATGVAAARSPRLERLLRPVLDVFQTMPQFVYLIPVVALFGVGRAPAVAAAVVYALPAVVRITTQGMRAVDPVVLESSRSLGATGWQQLRQVQLPSPGPRCCWPSTRAWYSSSPSSSSAAWSAAVRWATTWCSGWPRATWPPGWSRARPSCASG